MSVKDGNLKIYKIDKDNKELVLEGVQFNVYNVDEDKLEGTYTTDENGEIFIENLKTGNYKIVEIETNKWYNLASEVNVEVKWDKTTEIQIENELKKGQVRITKVDSEDNEIKIKDVQFNVLDENGNILETIKTNENGEATTSKYPVRDYENIYIQEKSTDENYLLNDEKIKVKLEENKLEDIVVENVHKRGNLKIYKVDKDNKELKLSNIVFDLYSEKEEKVIGTYTTDENGEIYIENLKIGDYKIIEKENNGWYNLADEKNVEVKWNETTETTIENELKKGRVRIVKIDAEDEEIKLEGVTFNVLDKDGNILEKAITDSNGEAITSSFALKDYKEIYLQETSTNENYILNDEKIKIELKENETEEVTVKNEKIKGQIKIIKTSENDSKVTGDKKGSPIEGIEFEIYNSKDKLIEKITTNKDGIAITSKLEKGKYKIKETKGNEWYYINENTFEAEIKQNNEIATVNITNEPKNPDIYTEKIGVDRAEVGSQIEYDISMRNSGNTYLDNFTWIDKIPYECIYVNKFQTGTYNQSLKYNLYYKTNLSNDEYILLMEDLSTSENYEIDFAQELADNEYVIEIKLEFGRVDIGFCSNENPHLFANVKSNLKSETTFVNIAKVSGAFKNFKVEDNSSWKTLVYKLLPKTGF